MKYFFILVSAAWLILAGSGVVPAYAAGPSRYEVQPGDTLFTIADRYGLSVDELARANGLGPNGWIYPGQQLVIPAFTSPPAPPAFTGTPNWSGGYGARELIPPPIFNNYIVQPGDTLYGIAQRYSTTVADLQAANRLSDFGPSIYLGQQLIIPAGTNTPAIDSILIRPALSGLPVWNTSPQWAEPNTNLQSWAAYPSQPPSFYHSATAQPASSFPNHSAALWPPNRNLQRWIGVDLTRQVLTAYEGQTPVFSSLVSSGLWQYPTVVGTFQIYVKYEIADMSGGAGEGAYYLPNVPYVMYFHGNYGLHGTYWHSNFGQPMSHGCVNLPTAAAEWLFSWAPLGTQVVTHY
jgi:LysM repeat protein